MQKVCVILHDIRSAENVGAIFRTSDAIGISKIYLSGYTPAPIDRFGRKRKDIAKSALGSEESVPWESIPSIGKQIDLLKKEKRNIVAIEQDMRAIDYKKYTIQKPTVFVVGNEVDGLPKEILQKCDSILEIPMRGRKESLNVSVAFGIALFRLLDV